MLRSDLFDRAWPWTQLIIAYGGLVNDLNLKWSNRVSVVLAWSFAACLPAGLIRGQAWIAAAALVVLFGVVNMPFYAFLARRRGVAFAAAAVPWHWLHYLCGGAGFALGAITYPSYRRRRARAAETAQAVEPAS